jgi:multidrug efflux pump subunit AcrA (membrane-fusion protein)
MKNSQQQQQLNVMASEAILTTPPATEATNANEAPNSPKLRRWVNFLELITNEIDPVEDNNCVAPFIKDAEEIRKARAEKRLSAKLRKMEVEQKAILLAEAQKSLEEARRKFESQPQLPYDYTDRPPSSINDLFRAEKARDELIALEQEQKEKLLKNLREQSKRECGVEWPPVYDGNEGARYDHIPKHPQFYIDMIKNAFPGAAVVNPKESNE